VFTSACAIGVVVPPSGDTRKSIEGVPLLNRIGRPFACSGLMYAAVPMMTPGRVAAGVVIVGDCDSSPTTALAASGASAFASPKSSAFTVPSARTLMKSPGSLARAAWARSSAGRERHRA
jgi:hypothetical protein